MRAQRVGSIAEQRLRDQRDDPQRRKFPATILVGEEKSGLPVHSEYGAEQNRRGQQSGDTGPERISAIAASTSTNITT